MIERLLASNFRRYEEIDLVFDEASQLVLIDGANGAGKSTILEAIHFALWGESRSGRRNLDHLVRRGAELEGMQAELALSVGGERYRVNRRRDGKSSTAVLYCNEEPLVEGPNEVTEEVGRILGMDAAGFRLAVTAHQGDLEGLVSLRPAERSRMVSRLLRLDAIGAARNVANDLARRERAIAQGLEPKRSKDELEKKLSETLEGLAAASRAESEAESAASELAVLMDELEPLASNYLKASTAHEQAERTAEALAQRSNELQSQLESKRIERVRLTHSDVNVRGAAEVQKEIGDLRVSVAQAEASSERALHRSSLKKDLAELEAELVRLKQDAILPEKPGSRSYAEELANEKEQLSALQQQLGAAQNRLRQIETEPAPEGLCTACGQEIPGSLQEELMAKRDGCKALAESDLAMLSPRISAHKSQIAEIEALERSQVEKESAYRETLSSAEHARRRVEDIEKRTRVYLERMADLPETPMQVGSLLEDLRELEEELSEAEAAAARAETIIRLDAAIEASERRLEDEKERLSEAEAAVEAYSPDKGLVEAYGEHLRAKEGYLSERQLAAHCSQQRAVLQERLSSIEAEEVEFLEQQKRKQEHQEAAISAGGAAKILSEASQALSQTVRPELEGSLSRVLEQMSEGRFPRAAIGEDYEVTVEDDGQLRTLEELSGGERDLVALALRLALSQTFTSHSGEGAGFLILDECFGSQDPERRRSVLAALRELRSEYRQLFIISHVEGLEDSADAVLHVRRTEDGTSTVEDDR